MSKITRKLWLIRDEYGTGLSDTPRAYDSKTEKILINESVYDDTEPQRSLPVFGLYEEDIYDNKSYTRPVHGNGSFPVLSPDDVRALTGRILTFIDATYTDKEQRTATKSFMRKILWSFKEDLDRMIESKHKFAKKTK